MKTKISAILTLAIVFGTPTIVKAEEQGAWAAVDSNGTVIGVDVCTESVCGSNGEWQGKVPYCDTCTYVYQLPADSNGNVAGYKDIKYDSATNAFEAPDNKIINGVAVPYPVCETLVDSSDKTKCSYTQQVSYQDDTKGQIIQVTTFGKYKTMNAVVKKIKPKKQKKGKKKNALHVVQFRHNGYNQKLRLLSAML